MSLLTLNLPALTNGVSQQPPQVRSPDQCEAQENAWASLADGLIKRPPTEAVAKLLNAPITNAYVHDINRDSSERYTVIVANGVIRVFAANGTEIAVEAPAGWGYLEGLADYATEVNLTTVADYTFVVNRKLRTAMLAADAPPPDPEDTGSIPPRGPGGSGWIDKPPLDPITET